MIDDSGVNIMDTPDAFMTKGGAETKPNPHNDEPVFAADNTNRRSYNRGAFQ